MGPLKIKAFVPKDHRVEIALPPEVPEGDVELEVTVSSAVAEVREKPYNWGPALDRLRDLRGDLKSLDLGLSDEIIRMRREEG
ncbi:MAG: hypothetical protein AAB368_09435 [bacterium]